MIKRKLAAEEIQEMKDGYIPAPYQLEEGEPVSYTHLDVYKRQDFTSDVWMGSRSVPWGGSSVWRVGRD